MKVTAARWRQRGKWKFMRTKVRRNLLCESQICLCSDGFSQKSSSGTRHLVIFSFPISALAHMARSILIESRMCYLLELLSTSSSLPAWRVIERNPRVASSPNKVLRVVNVCWDVNDEIDEVYRHILKCLMFIQITWKFRRALTQTWERPTMNRIQYSPTN